MRLTARSPRDSELKPYGAGETVMRKNKALLYRVGTRATGEAGGWECTTLAQYVRALCVTS